MQGSLLLQAGLLGEVCAGMGTGGLAVGVLSDNVYALLRQCMKLTPAYAVAGPLLLLEQQTEQRVTACKLKLEMCSGPASTQKLKAALRQVKPAESGFFIAALLLAAAVCCFPVAVALLSVCVCVHACVCACSVHVCVCVCL